MRFSPLAHEKIAEDFQRFKEQLLEVRGLRISDELFYLFDLFVGVLGRRLSRSKFFLGYFLPKGIILTIPNKENCRFLCQAGTDEIACVMPYSERCTWKKIKSIVKHGDICIDVGAHIGTYTIPLARIVGPNGLVVAVEPSPLKQVLSLNVRLNELQNVIIIDKPAFSEKRILNFYFSPSRTGWGSLYKSRVRSHDCVSMKMEAMPLDELLAEVGCQPKKVKLLKIDAEGAEAEVLQGARETLKITKYVVFEAVERTIQDCVKILSSAGFKVSLICSLEKMLLGVHNFLAIK